MTPTQSTSLAAYVDALPSSGSFSIWFGPGTGDPYLTHRADEPHYAASTMKLALVMAVYREAAAGALDLDVPVRVHNSFASRHDGSVFSIDPEEDSDPEPWRHLGEDVALRWLCYRAIVRSSNLATNLVLDAVGTTAVTAVLDRVGARDSTVTRGIEDATAREAGLQNVVTAADLARTLQALWSETLLSPDDSREVLAVLAAQQINDAIPARLPLGLGGRAQVRLDRRHLARRRHRAPRGRGRRRAVRLRHVYDVRPRRADRPRPHRRCRGRRLHGS